ncbi:MAG: tetratricopeptide repeat protein [Bryobacteraceae bacterium]|nr:tetratricopeptide repeat protein [Bryobacteraceae bacterium]
MIRLWLIFWLSVAQEPAPSGQQQPPMPPEEDETLKAPREYVFNPLQAKNELRIGNFYYKKGSMRAAALRFEEATRWDPTNAEGFLRLGEARERMGDKKAAQAAYAKYVELAPGAKDVAAIRKKLK